ncbi:MAG TPA: hypothetical protein VIJ92_02085, partial [Ginsengibacter sp.]
ELSKECGIHNNPETIGTNCAIALTLKDIFPNVFVSGNDIYPFGIDNKDPFDNLTIPMPKIARDFVKVFDSLSAIHKLRLRLPEFEFSIDIPDEVISEIDIEEVTTLTLQADSCCICQ